MLRILIVDDEPSYREYLTRFLRRECYEVRAAGSHDEALEVAEGFNPDMVLADWMLRDHAHGLDVAKSLRKIHAGLRIVLMTGFPTAEIRDEAKRAGVRGILEKPFGLTELARAISQAASAPASEGSPNVGPALVPERRFA